MSDWLYNGMDILRDILRLLTEIRDLLREAVRDE